jgi:predicted alpha/beta superfamily hydrolase
VTSPDLRSSAFRTASLLGFVSLLCAACSRPAPPPAGPDAALVPASIGETLLFESKVLGERRVINVYVPPGYAAPVAAGAGAEPARYPVLYMPDGGLGEDFPHVVGAIDVSIKNAIIRPVIVVGIENTERRRDLVGPSEVAADREAAPHAGGADRFRAFLRDELKPMIAARYRVSGESAIIGESLAGLFVVETFLTEPELFDGYLAASPSVWWNAEALVRSASARLGALATARAASGGLPPVAIYLATADEQAMQDGVELLTSALQIQAPAGITWRYEPMPHEHHGTIFPTAALHGIRWLFAAPADPAAP